jgi:flagellar hook-associated protein 2
MVSSVYNYYLSTYGGQEMTKYDSHKKSDLKNVYNTMLKVNRKSPLYKLGNLEETQKYAIDIKETARMFKNVASSLTNEDGSMAAFSKKKAGSSNEDLVSVEYIDEDGSSQDAEDFSIQVKNLAKPQTNVSGYMNPEGHSIPEGSYSFDFGIGKYTYEFSFDVPEDKDNSEVQKQIARLINRSDIGAYADIVTNEKGDTALSITSDKTGVGDLDKQGRTFVIEDNHKSDDGDIVKLMGLDQISTMPQNAVFDINGEEHTASSNKFMVMDHYRVTLNDESDETVQIEMKPDFDAMLDNVSDLVNVYNSMVDMASSHITDAEDSDRLLKEIQRVTKVHKEDLDSSGFMVQDDGHIDIDESLILQSANEGKVEDSLETLNSLKKDLVRKADDMSINPMNYVNKKLIAYPNPVRNFTSPYVSSIYSGMMFNGYI